MKILLVLILFSTSLNSISQDLKLSGLVSFYKKDRVYIEEYIIGRGWTFLSASDGGNENLSELAFSYKKNSYSDKATAFFSIFYNDIYKYKVIALQFHDPKVYSRLINEINVSGYKLKTSEVEGDNFKKSYSGPNRIIILRSKQARDKDEINSSHTNYYLEVRTP